MIYKRISTKHLSQIQKVLNLYDLGQEKCTVSQNTLANVNKVFLVKIRFKKYILRESSPTTTLSHLRLEAEILDYLAKKKFHLTPSLIPNTKGDLITLSENKRYSLQEFLPGEVKEGVSNLIRFNDAKLVSFFQASAGFTRNIKAFKGHVPRDNKSLYYYVKNGKKILRSSIDKLSRSPVQQLLNDNKPFLDEFIQGLLKEMKVSGYDAQPKQIVHFDIHPGNVNYVGDNVSGLFDFDWARWDCRLTDLACTIGQSCYSYRGKKRSLYDEEKIKLGLKVYRKAYGKSEYNLVTENRLLRAAFKGYMLYQLFWIIEWYKANLDKPEEGLKYVTFSINVLKLNNFEELI